MTPRQCFVQQEGLALLEFSVIIFTILLFLSLLLNEMQKLRQSKATVTCMGNLRQLGMSLYLYCGDNQGKLPFPNHGLGHDLAWCHAIDPYLLNRPAATHAANRNLHLVKQDPIIRQLSPYWHTNAYTLKMNLQLGRSPHDLGHTNDYFYSLQEIGRPSQTVLLFDGRVETDLDNLIPLNPQGTEGYVARRHSDRANVLFIDGHVELRNEKHKFKGDQGLAVNETRLIWKPWEDEPGR